MQGGGAKLEVGGVTDRLECLWNPEDTQESEEQHADSEVEVPAMRNA